VLEAKLGDPTTAADPVALKLAKERWAEVVRQSANTIEGLRF
jgi:hypothetical protein